MHRAINQHVRSSVPFCTLWEKPGFGERNGCSCFSPWSVNFSRGTLEIRSSVSSTVLTHSGVLGSWKEPACCYLFWAEPLVTNVYQQTLPYAQFSFEMLWRCITNHQNSQDTSLPHPLKKINRIELCSETNSVPLNTRVNIRAFSI